MNKIIKVLNRKKIEKNIENKSDVEIFNECSTHDLIFFSCEECGENGSRIRNKFINEKDFICKKCKLSKVDRSSYKKPKFGSEHYSKISKMRTKENLEKAKQSRKETVEKKYGVKNVMQLKEIQDKQINSMKEKYGVERPFQIKEVKEVMRLKTYSRTIERIKEKYKIIPLFELKDFSFRFNKNEYKWKCIECDLEFLDDYYDSKLFPRCPNCSPKSKNYSLLEKEMTDFIGGKKFRDEKFEIDCFVEEKNIGFEFDGLYWHSDKFLDKNYHITKQKHFAEVGKRIYHIFEDEWQNKKEIVKSIINTKLEKFNEIIYARKTDIKLVNSDEARKFQNENHIQGAAQSSINIGLYYDNDLVSLMTFAKSRFGKKYEWELVRFVNKLNTKIIGGASKLFKYFIKLINPNNIVSYSDERLFDGGLYKTLGFEFLHLTPPQYFYIKHEKRFNRMLFQKKFLRDKLKNFDENLTEEENMLNNGFLRIYDCGNKVWVWTK